MVVMLNVRFPLSLRSVEDLLFERGLDIGHETVRFWWNRFGPLFAGDIRKRRMDAVKELGNEGKQHVARYANNRVENSHLPVR